MKPSDGDRVSLVILSCVGGGPMERLAAELRARGHEAQVVSEYSAADWRANMHRGPASRWLTRLRVALVFPLRALLLAMRAPRQAILVPTTNPFFLPLWLTLSRIVHGRRVVPLVYDLYPDALIAAGLTKDESSLARLGRHFNRSWFRRADGLVFIGEHMSEHARATYGQPAVHTVIETGASAAELAGVPRTLEPELERWIADRRVISYVGNFGHVHDWKTLADAIPRLLRSTHTPPAVVIAASGPRVARLRAAWEPLGGDHIRFLEPLDDSAWARLLQRTDIALATLARNAGHTSIPSKSFSAMAAGSAVAAVAPAESDLAATIRAHSSGFVVEPGDSAGLVAGLTTYLDSPAALDRARRRARDAIARRYDMPVLGDRWIELARSLPRRRARLYPRLKRCFDLGVAVAGLVLFSPILAAVALAIRITMGGPVLFRQVRPGCCGRPFTMIKFRTMRKGGESEGPDTDAARITRLGAFLRATSLDELPSLWCVVRGDLSLVGPRPLLTRYLPRYSPRQARRHEVVPGLTGWAQVRGRNAITWEEKFELDLEYVDNQSLWMDLKILFLTVRTVLGRSGVSGPGHATMPEFTGSGEGSRIAGDA